MRILTNTGTDRVVDAIKPALTRNSQFDVVSAALSLFAFEHLKAEPRGLQRAEHG